MFCPRQSELICFFNFFKLVASSFARRQYFPSVLLGFSAHFGMGSEEDSYPNQVPNIAKTIISLS
jgi:hypothetical protein